MERKIVSTFMFSEPHEQDLLWLKFNIENPFINEWIITESSYTFQGKGKPLFLKNILNQERFSAFRNKIHYIEINRNFNFEFEPCFIDVFKRKVKRWLNKNRNAGYEFVAYAELASFHAEINQRQACVEYIKEKYDKNDIVLLCDTDEIFDFNEGKIEVFEHLVNNTKTPFYIKREIFCYDYDNYSNRERYSPIIIVDNLKLKNATHVLRHPLPNERNIIHTGDSQLAFEYTFCFSKDSIVRKLRSFSHVTELNESDLEFCFSNNIVLTSPEKIDEKFKTIKENFYEKVILNETNSPIFLRNNFEIFKTGIVSEDYKDNRIKNNIRLCQ